MKLKGVDKIQRKQAALFTLILFQRTFKLLWVGVFRPKHIEAYAHHFSELYSKLWDYAEHSISNRHFNLPTALGQGPAQAVNHKLAKLYKSSYACLSFGGSSGAILILLTAVLPKLQTTRKLILFDQNCHQSTIGGLVFGRWQAVRIPRVPNPNHGTTHPIECSAIISLVEKHGAQNVAAIFLVLPSYDGFRSKSEEMKIYKYAKSQGILLFIDGAWDATTFRAETNNGQSLLPLCDAWLTSPHKRGLLPSSLGCMITNNKHIAGIWDEALDLGFRSSSISFVDIMISEHRLNKTLNGEWNLAFSQADEAAQNLSERIPEIHPDIYAVRPEHVGAESLDPAHILISTSNLKSVDARVWAQYLSQHFDLDVEKATVTTLLLLCASPTHKPQINQTISSLRDSLQMTLDSRKVS